MALRLREQHPGLAVLQCSTCQKFVHNIPSGEPETMDDGSLIPRPGPTPCDRCPKGSPDNERFYQLSWKNYLTVELWKRFKTGVVKLPPHLEQCPVLADNFAIIEDVVSDARASANNREIADLIGLHIARMR